MKDTRKWMKRLSAVLTIFLLGWPAKLADAQLVEQQAVADSVTGQPTQASVAFMAPLGTAVGTRVARIPILMYHHIGWLPEYPDAYRRDLTVTPPKFVAQMRWMKQQGYNSITLHELYLYSQGLFVLPEKPFVISFDDGYQDVFRYAVPVLKSYGFVGSWAIITDFVGRSEYATWEQLKSVAGKEMEIVSHTSDHFDGALVPSSYTTGDALNNLIKSRQDLYTNLNIDTDILIYPFGHYTDDYLKMAQRAGFVMGVTTHAGIDVQLNDLMRIPRVRVSGEQTLAGFKLAIQGEGEPSSAMR